MRGKVAKRLRKIAKVGARAKAPLISYVAVEHPRKYFDDATGAPITAKLAEKMKHIVYDPITVRLDGDCVRAKYQQSKGLHHQYYGRAG